MKKICMLGCYAVGKTSLVRRFVEGIFQDTYLTTVGVRIDRKRVRVGGTELHLMLWDLCGEDEITQPRSSYFRGASGYIMVADGCRRKTTEIAVRMQQRAISVSGPAPVVVAMNKADLKAQWDVGPTELQLLTDKEWTYLETSAKSGDGVDSIFMNLAQKMLTDVYDHSGR